MTIKMKKNDGDRMKIGLWNNAKRKLSNRQRKKMNDNRIRKRNERNTGWWRNKKTNWKFFHAFNSFKHYGTIVSSSSPSSSYHHHRHVYIAMDMYFVWVVTHVLQCYSFVLASYTSIMPWTPDGNEFVISKFY